MTALKVLTPFPRIIHVKYTKQKPLATAFMRMQEFYESSIEGFRGGYFTREDFKKAYMRDTGCDVFTYCTDWAGFNVPGRVVNKFVRKFDLDASEQRLIDAILEHKPARGRYYVIGTFNNDFTILDHELSHAFWELDPKYSANMMRFVKALPEAFRHNVRLKLEEMGYCKEVLDDETTAYLSTSSMSDLTTLFGNKDIPWQRVLQFQQAFKDYLLGKRLGKK